MTREELKARVCELEIELQLAERAISTSIACLAVEDRPYIALRTLRKYMLRRLTQWSQEIGEYDD